MILESRCGPLKEMVRWMIAIVVLGGLLVALLWPKGTVLPPRTSQDKAAQLDAPKQDNLAPGNLGPRVGTRSPGRPTAEKEDTNLLNIRSREFNRLLDQGIPSGFREAAAECDYGGLDPDLFVELSMELRIMDGEVSAANVSVLESDLNNAELEQCMVRAVEQARFRNERWPNWQQPMKLLIRLTMLSKYRR